MPEKRKFLAYTLPMVTFVLLLGVGGLLPNAGDHFLLSASEYWIYPIQTIVCGALLIWFWRDYDLQRPRRVVFTFATGVAVLLIWVAPQTLFGASARPNGFNPDIFAAQPGAYWATVSLRFLRLAVVVPLMEEIFWRGFLLRFLISERFTRVPFGAFSWQSFGVVTVLFCVSHSLADWPAAFITGAVYNGVAYRTRNLSSCILAHAITNLLLGLWIMKTKQWGFW